MTFKVPFRSDAQIDRDGRDAAGGGVMHQHTGSSRTAPLCPCLMCYRERGGRLIDLECGPLPDDMNVDVPAMLDQIAMLRADLAASQREIEQLRTELAHALAEADRWRHGVPLEGLAGLDATIGHLVDRINARDAAVNARLAEVERRLSDHDMRLCDHDGRIVKAQRKADGHG